MLKEIKKRKTQAADVIQSLTYELYFKPGKISLFLFILLCLLIGNYISYYFTLVFLCTLIWWFN